MIVKLKSHSDKDTEKIGKALAYALDRQGVSRAFTALRGEMGVGKTAFTRGFASALDINGVKSPTYTVMNQYRGRRSIYHFDFYRIADEDDLYSIGYDDIVDSEGYCIGEWSENVEQLLPEGHITVTISRVGFESRDEDERDILIEIPDSFGLGENIFEEKFES